MPIRYSNVVGGSGSAGFNLDVGASGNTTFYLDSPQPAGAYSITSQLADSTIEFYAIAEDGTLAGYTNTKALSATKDFDTLVVYGVTTNDLITFEYKVTASPTASGDQDSGAAPYITSISDADLPDIDDTTIIAGGNFATDVTVTFTGTDSVVRNAKSVVRTNSNQLIVTRPDDLLEDNSPYSLTVSNPGITQSAIVTNASTITAGSDPVWDTASGSIFSGFSGDSVSVTVSATDPDGGNISYSIASGSLPTGLSLDPSTGEISGTSSGAGSSFVISATDSANNTTNRSFSIELLQAAATGGTITAGGEYVVHTFTASGTFTPTENLTAEYLVIAGGGGGGGNMGGGGGAGGYRSSVSGELSGGGASAESALNLTASTAYTVTVGAGGNGGSYVASAGNNSVFSTITSTGGGDGGARGNAGDGIGGNGGSGGGGTGTGTATSRSGGTGVANQGYNGGLGFGYPNGTIQAAGGGGGAGAQGTNSGNTASGSGGVGVQSSITGLPVYRAGGGGGAEYSDGSPGGLGGGGDGGASPTAGTANTGGGGGGGFQNPAVNGAAGGSGIVIIRYQI